MKKLRSLVTAAGLVLTIGHPVLAAAQARDPRREPRKVEKPKPPEKVLRLEELKVEGRIQKPQAMFLMPRANLNVRDLERSEPFLPKVVEALDREPF